MKHRHGMRANRRLVAIAVAGVTLGGCAFDPSAVTVPGSGRGEAYRLHVEFTNALNLPARAKVMADGVQVGDLAKVTVVDPTATVPGHVIADLDIDRAVQLPARTTAQLRQNTLLGDVFIELSTPTDSSGGQLTDDSSIPLAQTKPAVQVEDVMAGLATFFQGGAVNQLRDLVNRMNAVLPQQPAETARIAQVVGFDLENVAGHLDEVDRFLDGIEASTAMVLQREQALGALLTEDGTAHVAAAMESLILVLGVAGVMGDVVRSMSWLAPLASAGNASAKAFVPLLFTNRPLDLNAPSNLNRIVSLLRDRIIPFTEHGAKVNLTRIDTGTGIPVEEQTARMIETLRMIGAVR